MSDSSVKSPIKTVPLDTVPVPTESSVGKVTKAKDYVGLVVTSLPVLGALGTAAVWALSYFYVGSVDLNFKKPYHNINVDVYNPKGSQTTFHTPHFELMPGHYFFMISVDGKPPVNCPAEIAYGRNTQVQVDDPQPLVNEPQPVISNETSSSLDEEDTTPPKKRKWWQFWRK
jgi:hypothetical protein